jgi:hypothetical protein
MRITEVAGATVNRRACFEDNGYSLFLFTFGGMAGLMSKKVAATLCLNWRGQGADQPQKAGNKVAVL